jgi:aminoglycoside/choline kinase family phosphotransferase
METPRSPVDLTSPWLTMALREANVLSTGGVKAFECIPLGGEKGFYGQIVRLKLTYDPPETGGPRTLIAKFSSGNPEMRQRPSTKASYEREVRFYQTMAVESSLPVPTCYHSSIDIKSGWHVLLLEDLAPAKSGSRIDGCSRTQAETAIKHIAEFHAHWWEDPRLDDLDWLASAPKAPADAHLAELHEKWWTAFLREVGHELPGAVMEIGESLGEQRGPITRHLWAERPRTLIHSDYQLENLLFGADATSFFVVDWQFVKHGRGIWDVAYFLSENLLPADRRAVEMDLLRGYVRVLSDHGVSTYSFEDAMHDYKLSLLHRLGALISTIAAMPFTEEQIKMHVDVLLPRTISAILDHDAGSVLCSSQQGH